MIGILILYFVCLVLNLQILINSKERLTKACAVIGITVWTVAIIGKTITVNSIL